MGKKKSGIPWRYLVHVVCYHVFMISISSSSSCCFIHPIPIITTNNNRNDMNHHNNNDEIITTTTNNIININKNYRRKGMNSNVILFGKKRGNLAKSLVDDDSWKNNNTKKISSSSKKNKKKNESKKSKVSEKSAISSKLAQWAEQKEEDGTATTTTTLTEEDEDDDDANDTNEEDDTNFVPFESMTKDDNNDDNKGSGGKRRERQAQRKRNEISRKASMQSTLDQLNNLLNPTSTDTNKKQTSSYITSILSTIQRIIKNGEEDWSIRVLISGQRNRSYRLAWVGSDDAITHLGTGLHKVPLARLQEVFLTMGKNKIEIFEIIRIIGPFPNVRNTLRGSLKLLKSKSNSNKKSNKQQIQITYESMIDGAGKELLADSNRVIDLNVWYADNDVMICTYGDEEDEEDENNDEENSWMGKDGSKVLLFVAENELQTQLEILRVD